MEERVSMPMAVNDETIARYDLELKARQQDPFIASNAYKTTH